MKKNIAKKLSDFEKAVINLRAVKQENLNELEQDGLITRFNLAYETGWKLLRELILQKGLDRCDSPRDVFKYAIKMGWIENEQLWMDMIEDRNITIHTYDGTYSRTVVNDLPVFLDSFEKLLQTMKIKIAEL